MPLPRGNILRAVKQARSRARFVGLRTALCASATTAPVEVHHLFVRLSGQVPTRRVSIDYSPHTDRQEQPLIAVSFAPTTMS